MSGSIIVKVELPLDLYGKLARATNSEVGRLLRTLATRAARMEQQEINYHAQPPRAVPPIDNYYPKPPREGTRDAIALERTAFIKEQLEQGQQVRDIANALGVNRSAVYKQMTRFGFTPPTRAERTRGIPSLNRAGYFPDEIARTLNLEVEFVEAELKRLAEAS